MRCKKWLWSTSRVSLACWGLQNPGNASHKIAWTQQKIKKKKSSAEKVNLYNYLVHFYAIVRGEMSHRAESSTWSTVVSLVESEWPNGGVRKQRHWEDCGLSHGCQTRNDRVINPGQGLCKSGYLRLVALLRKQAQTEFFDAGLYAQKSTGQEDAYKESHWLSAMRILQPTLSPQEFSWMFLSIW